MSSKENRDYYKHLFSPDSDDFYSLEKTTDSQIDAKNTLHVQERTSQNNVNEYHFENMEKIFEKYDVNREVQEDTIYIEEDNSDMSISTTSSQDFLFDESNQVDIKNNKSQLEDKSFTQVTPDTFDTSSLSSLESVSSNQKRLLLSNNAENLVKNRNAYFHKVLQRVKKAETEHIQTHRDIIGCFNIQNKYDHGIAAKLFLDGNFTFLSLQEPFAHQERNLNAWKACRKNELQSARICCFETNHQILLYDSWKWGGKVIADFDSKLDGRITSIAFEFAKNQKLGIISIYAMARGGSASKEEEQQKEQLRQTTVFLVKKLHKSWMKRFPGMQIMILGDMQETYSISDRDNSGATRLKNTKENGIVAAFREKYTSVVREKSSDSQYLTRFGHKGARGIDHILFPDNERAKDLIENAEIDKDGLGNSLFASDHKLIQCSYIRRGENNEEQGEETTRFAYNKLSQIKLKRHGNEGDSLQLDDTQFKESKRYKEHAHLYKKVQNLTGDSAEATDFYLAAMEIQIKKLYKSLWESGIEQNVRGDRNELVKISESQAAELSQLLNRFEAGVQDIMTFLQLVHESDCLSKGATTRNTIRLKNGDFKPFSNLPIATKLRYLRANVQLKRRRIEGYIHLLNENNSDSSNPFESKKIFDQIKKSWNKTLNTKAIESKAGRISTEYLSEAEERAGHMKAFDFHSKKKGNDAITPCTAIGLEGPEYSQFDCVSETTVKLINCWLGESDCHQGFCKSSAQTTFEFLNNGSIVDWINSCKHIEWNVSYGDSAVNEIAQIKENLETAQKELKKLESKLSKAQVRYRADSLFYLLKVNKIEAFTKKVLPKAREVPATHTEIWDAETNIFRKCKNDVEELIATGNFHGDWMAASKASEACAFAKLKSEGLLGTRGIELNPERKVTMDDIPKLIHNGEKLSTKLKKAFVRAHGNHTARLFRPLSEDNKELFYPFFLTDKEGGMNNDSIFKESFWKSLSTVPGKARYNGFHMAVIGRFGKRWQDCLFHINKLILLMRYVPYRLKRVARFPIPKPGRVNEYRPISLCHDVYCFINAICTSFSSTGIEKANILHSGIAAYIKGRGCTTLVGVEQGVREDCIESGIPSSQTDEDEEKFFDRIPVEILLAAMRVNGFPEQGFLELKASGMEEKTVEIITGKGVGHARFVCGLEQGNPDSPTMANLVIKFKHDLWLNILENIEHDRSKCDVNLRNSLNIAKNKDAYRMHVSDKEDGIVEVDRIGYCDDNTRYTSSFCEEDVINATKHYIQHAGDLSLVTKIGRKGSKSEVHYFNLTAETAVSLSSIESIAWSFTIDGPQIEKVPHKMCLQDRELQKIYKLTKFHELDSEKQQEILNVYNPKAHKHLGMKSTLNGDSSSGSIEVLNKIKNRIRTLRISNMEKEAQNLCSNMLCSTVHSYAPLQMGHTIKDLQDCDEILVQNIMKRHGLSHSDAKHILFIGEKHGGYGFKSFVDTDVVANARELEIGLNGSMLDAEVMRARTSAFLIRHNNPSDKISLNYMGKAISKLAAYGFHIRDRKDGIINYVMSILNGQKRFCTIGNERYNGMKNYSIGEGSSRNLDLAFGGKFHVFLKTAISNEGILHDNVQVPEGWKLPTTLNVIRKTLKDAKTQMFHDISKMYNCWEWRRNSKTLSYDEDIRNPDNWKFINVSNLLQRKFGIGSWKLTAKEVHSEAMIILKEQEEKFQMRDILNHESPIFVASDGSLLGNDNNETQSSTTGAAVLCIMDLHEGESISDGKWVNRPAIPIIARAAQAPTKLGTSFIDIGHGEGIGLCLALELFQQRFPKVYIMDSQAVRLAAQTIRDRPNKLLRDRIYIRKIASGISKNICERLEYNFKEGDMNSRTNILFQSKQHQQGLFMEFSRKWTDTSETSNTHWTSKYWDAHNIFPIFKVDSHQLDTKGKGIKTDPRYDKLVPNLFLLSCNHYADLAADLLHSHRFQSTQPRYEIKMPSSGLRFFVTCDGQAIDKHISDVMVDRFQKARIRELKRRATQGLPWRIMDTACMTWDELRNNKSLFRSSRGLSRTHTRSLYKSTIYRKGWMNKELEAGTEEQVSCLTDLSESKWNIRLASCKWCTAKSDAKGNRYHAILFCSNPRLKRFRQKMDRLIEQKLNSLLIYITQSQNAWTTHIFLTQIESVIAALHRNENEKDSDSERLLRYRNRDEWIREEGFTSLENLLNSQIPIYSMIFGIIPITELIYKSDAELSAAMCIPLGIMHKDVEKEVKKMSNNVAQLYQCKKERKLIKDTYWKKWTEIKQICVAKVVGLHKIIGDISHDFEDVFRKEYGSEKGFQKDTIKSHCGKPKIKLEKDDRPGNSKQNNAIKKRKISETVDGNLCKVEKDGKEIQSFTKRKRFCTGITCNTSFKLWNYNFRTNEIESEKKHCQRCSRHQTGVRQGIKMLKQCIIVNDGNWMQEFVRDLDDNVNDINYTSVARHLAEVKTDKEIAQNNKELVKKMNTTRKRKGIPDDQKTMIKAISTCITRLTCRADNSSKRICQAVEELNKTTVRVDKFLKDDLRHTKEINKRVLNTSYNKKHIVSNNSGDSQPKVTQQHDATSNEREEEIHKDVSHTLGSNQWMHSSTMDRAIKSIRCTAPSTVFVANTSISVLLSNWDGTRDWPKFALAFRSRIVLMKKPDGIYLIPIFTGMTNQGHWSLAVVHKARENSRMWILNSLGQSDGNSKEAKAVCSLFSKTRSKKCKWVEIRCRKQTEVECGSRTIAAMVSIVQQIKEGVQIEVAVEKATLKHIPIQDYNSINVRSIAATCLRSMTDEDTVIDRNREMELRRALKKLRRKKNGILRGHGDLRQEEIIDLADDDE